jgi:N-methylhydantoinase B/oxoprolinase/acetone carboxylase alpha subunit
MCETPTRNLGDLKELVGALNTNERKVHAMLAKFGRDAFRDGLSELLDWAERQACEILRSIRVWRIFLLRLHRRERGRRQSLPARAHSVKQGR